MKTKDFLFGLTILALMLTGVGTAFYALGGKEERNKPAVFVHGAGIFACNKLYAVVLSDSKGGVVAATPSSANAAEVIKAAEALPPKTLLAVTLEVGCGQPDTSADRSR